MASTMGRVVATAAAGMGVAITAAAGIATRGEVEVPESAGGVTRRTRALDDAADSTAGVHCIVGVAASTVAATAEAGSESGCGVDLRRRRAEGAAESRVGVEFALRRAEGVLSSVLVLGVVSVCVAAAAAGVTMAVDSAVTLAVRVESPIRCGGGVSLDRADFFVEDRRPLRFDGAGGGESLTRRVDRSTDSSSASSDAVVGVCLFRVLLFSSVFCVFCFAGGGDGGGDSLFFCAERRADDRLEGIE